MKAVFNILLWVIGGLVLGLVLFALVQPPASNGGNFTIPPQVPPPGSANNTTYVPPEESKVFLTLIDTSECGKCVNGSQALEETRVYLDSQPNIRVVTARTLDLLDPDAQNIIDKYDITQLPALIVSGDAVYPADFVSTWNRSVGSRESDGTFVSRKFPAPYYDLLRSAVVGLTRGIAIDPYRCPDCASASGFLYTLEDPSIGNVYFAERKLLNENSTEAQELIAKYNITLLPTVLLSSEIADYTIFSEISNLDATGDGWYVVRNVRPPYVDLRGNRTVRGLVDAVFIVNSSCGDCMNISEISDLITSPNGVKAVALRNKTAYDIYSPQAEALVGKYNITAIPTILYSPEISIYPNFEEFWTIQNNTIEEDGWFVFRAHNLVGLKYQNISG